MLQSSEYSRPLRLSLRLPKMILRTLLLLAASLATSVSAYIPEVTSTNNLNVSEVAPPPSSSRRSFFGVVSSAFGASLAIVSNPSSAIAAAGDDAFQKKQMMPIETYLYTVLRVREATAQETRLIKTGKFKDAARGNVKLAVRFMLNNYRLSDNIIAAASFLNGQQQIQAGADGQKAVQALYTILEYFDASGVENIKVDSLAGKEQIVINGLEAAQKSLDTFLSYFPASTLDPVKAKIEEENSLNAKEFDTSLGAIINPNPRAAVTTP